MLCKIHFFYSVASVLEPFLRGYQSSKPLAWFLYQVSLKVVKKLITLRQKESFQLDCIKFLECTTVKIMGRSPLNYKVTWALSCLVPTSMAKNRLLCEK